MEETKQSENILEENFETEINEEEKKEPRESRNSSTIWIRNLSVVGLIVEVSQFAFFPISTTYIPPKKLDIVTDESYEIDTKANLVTVKIAWTETTFSAEYQMELRLGTLFFKKDFVHSSGRPLFIISGSNAEELKISSKYNFYPGIECPSDGFWTHQVNIEDIKLGDHIYTWNGIIQNHAIVTRKGEEDGLWRVAYFCKASNENRIKEALIEQFCKEKDLRRAQYGESGLATFFKHGASYQELPLPPKQVVLNAERLRSLRWGGYNILYNNSESFAFYCKTGHFRSRQVSEHSNKIIPSAGIGAAVGAMGGVVLAEEGLVLAACVGGAAMSIGAAVVVGLLGVGAVALFKQGGKRKTSDLEALLKKYEAKEELRHQQLTRCLRGRPKTQDLTPAFSKALGTVSEMLPIIFSSKSETEGLDQDHRTQEEEGSPSPTSQETHLTQLCNLVKANIPKKASADDFLLFLEELIRQNPDFNYFRERYILWSELDNDNMSEKAYLLCCLEAVMKNFCREYEVEYPSFDELS